MTGARDDEFDRSVQRLRLLTNPAEFELFSVRSTLLHPDLESGTMSTKTTNDIVRWLQLGCIPYDILPGPSALLAMIKSAKGFILKTT